MGYTNVIPGPEQALHLRNTSTNNATPEHISRISFSFHVTKSRISITNSFGPRRTRSTTRAHSFYAPADTKETLYEVLGITDSESTIFSDIKKAYRSMARKYHPDVSPPDRVDEHARRFIIVHEAYQTLSDPETRALYDKDLVRGLRLGISPRGTTGEHDQRMEEKGGWKISWQSQLDELKQRNVNKDSRGNMSWGARMRNQRL